MPESKFDAIKKLQDDCRLALESPPGRIIIEYFLGWCDVYAPIIEKDPLAMARREGKRQVAVHMLELAGYAPLKMKGV